MDKIATALAAIVIIVIVAAAGYTVLKSNATSQSSSSVPSTTQIYSATTAPATVSVSNNTNKSVGNTYAVNVAHNAIIGNYLVNGTGFALYTFSADTPNSGTSACYASCATFWPPFYASKLTLPAGLNGSDFGTINRTDGTKQITYNGAPLYLFVKDKAAGQVNGNGVNAFGGVWHVAVPNVSPAVNKSASINATTTQQTSSSQPTTSTSGYGGYG